MCANEWAYYWSPLFLRAFCRSDLRPPPVNDEDDEDDEDEEILGSDDDEQEDPKDYIKGG